MRASGYVGHCGGGSGIAGAAINDEKPADDSVVGGPVEANEAYWMVSAICVEEPTLLAPPRLLFALMVTS